tara:strand:- start:490 stop:669 length:180 start_codon:yes stop_codon:yes gene_type:complete
MKKLVYKITPTTNAFNLVNFGGDTHYIMEFVTDRTPEWTEKEYKRNRQPLNMELISNEN